MRITDAMSNKGTYQRGETNQDIIVNTHMREEKDLYQQVYSGTVTLHSVIKTKKVQHVKQTWWEKEISNKEEITDKIKCFRTGGVPKLQLP